MESEYKIKIGEFEGPYNTLLDLIDKEKLSINELSLSKVADEYISYINNLKNFPTSDVASFIVVASTLMLIKSRSLLPGLDVTIEEETSIEELEHRLAEYKKIRERTKYIKELFGKNILWGREAFCNIEPQFIEPEDLTTEKIIESLKKLISNLPTKEVLPKAAIKKIISLEEKMKSMIKRIEEKIQFCFHDIANSSKVEKVDVIVNFLALLELFRRGVIAVKQENNFGEINISKQ